MSRFTAIPPLAILLCGCVGDARFETKYCVRPDGSKYIIQIYDAAKDKCQRGEHFEPLLPVS